MMKLVSIGKVADLFGVSPQTIRNWTLEGMFSEHRSQGGHRRYSLQEIGEIKGIQTDETRKTCIYARVSSYDQKEDLKRQVKELKEYCKRTKEKNVEILVDIGSGINYNKSGLKKLIRRIILGQVDKVIVSYRDRFLRFGTEILEQLCQLKDIELVILHSTAEKSFESRLVEDVLTILRVYSSKIYGRRSHEKRQKAIKKG